MEGMNEQPDWDAVESHEGIDASGYEGIAPGAPSTEEVSTSAAENYAPNNSGRKPVSEAGQATPRWMLRARCREAAPGDFFPNDGTGVEQAKKVCHECPVENECLEYALTYRIDHGVWGGHSERERRRILRQRRLAGGA